MFTITDRQLRDYIAKQKALQAEREKNEPLRKREKAPQEIHQYNKKFICVSEEVHKTLKRLKGDKSFNEFFDELLNERTGMQATIQHHEKRLAYVESLLKER